eukprot:Skav208165  [mRNA]  locus=scaffold1044:69532:74191:- [translate_table: standard]
MSSVPISDGLRTLLQHFDTCGMIPATSAFQERKHVLLDEVQMYREGDQIMLKGFLVQPEGGSSAQYMQGVFTSFADVTSTKETTIIAWEGNFVPSSFPKKVLLWNLVDAFHQWRGDQADFCFDGDSLFLPFTTEDRNSLHIFEPFGGGYGGWSFAGRVIHKHTDIPLQFVTLDSDFMAIKHFAMHHNCSVIDGTVRIPFDAFEKEGGHVLIHSSLQSHNWWEAVKSWGVDVMTISAPCPPWSNATAKAGLGCSDGLLLPHCILLLRIFRPKVVIIEQVKGFGSHPQKMQVLDCLKHVGYGLRWCRIFDASQFGGSLRSRWLGLATKNHEEGIAFNQMQLWPSVPQLTPQALGAVLPDTMIDVQQLQITDDMRACGSSFSMLPGFEKNKLRGASAERIWLSRCATPQEVAKTFMSKYGQQHLFEVRILEEKGYLGHFLALIDHEGRVTHRLHHPLEIMMIHLTIDSGFVARNYLETWVQVGNCICLPHALLLLANAVRCFEQKDVNVEELFHAIHRILTYEQWHTAEPDTIQESQVSEHAQDEHEVTPTAFYSPVVKAETQLRDQRLFVWINGDVSPAALCELFHLPLQVTTTPPNDLGISFAFTAHEMVNVHNAPWLSRQGFSFGLLPLVQRDALTIVLLDPTKSCDDAAKDLLDSLGDGEWFDQFGDVLERRRITHATAFFPEPIQHHALHTLPFFLVAAQQQVEIGAVWDITKACTVFRIQGEETAVKVIAQLWSQALIDDTMHLIQQKCHLVEMPGHATLTFSANTDAFLLPKDTMQEVLQIAVVRRIFDAIHTPSGVPVILKWNSRTLWQGNCDTQMTVMVMLSLLEAAFAPFLGTQAVRLICRGRVWYEVSLEELMRHSNSSTLTFHLQFQTAGGAGSGSKDTLRTYVKNTVAATLLEQGYPFQWTASTVDQLMEATGTKFMSNIVAMPQGYARLEKILQACRDASIVIPDRVVNDAVRTSAKGNQIMRDKKRQVVQPDPRQYQLELSYLQNEDGSTPLQLEEVSAQKTGLVLVSLAQASVWIKENRFLTKDELTLAIIGHHQLDTSLATQTCNLPCLDGNGRAVILATTLCHLGEKRIQPTSNTQKIDEQVCATIALTLWRDDWSEKEWLRALEHTYAFIKNILTEHSVDSYVESMWGRSIRGENKQKGTAVNAVSIQVHFAVHQTKIVEFLKFTGFCKLHATPKGSDGRISPDWRVIWAEGDRAHLHALSTQTAGCAGMVRNRNTWGLRFSATDFPAAWRIIHGDKKMPDDIHIRHMYRVEPLPFGCTADMLSAWSKILPWPLRPIKALGPRSWLVGSATPPPAGVHCFNANPVLIKLVQPKGHQEASPILAGPKPSKQAVKAPDADQSADPHYDPWAKAATARREANNAAAAQTRALQGPIESRFNGQDEKILQLEKALHEVQSNQVQLRAETEKGFAAVESREKQLHQSIQQVRSDLEQSFTGAISAQSTQLNATLADLKKLLVKTKRDRGKEEDDMSDS